MKLTDLITRLEEYREELGGDTEVRLMIQRNWPFECAVTGLVSGQEINDCDCDWQDDDQDVPEDDMVFIVQGEQLRYGSQRAWEAAY